MGANVATYQEVQALREQLAIMTDRMTAIERQMQEYKPCKWYNLHEAAKLFITRKGKHISRPTMVKWVERWIKSGKLREGYNMLLVQSESGMLAMDTMISETFLHGITPPAQSHSVTNKLKIA
jgi:hypothetical protein